VADDVSDLLEQRSLRDAAIGRSVAGRYAQAADEVQRIIDATYRVIEREGAVEPKVRDILAEAGLANQAFYRHFASKDDLLLVILDDGRRRIAGYLAHRMEKVAAKGAVAQVQAWIEGVMAQAADPDAASRTRPFVAGLQRLTELHPDQQRASVDLLVSQVAGALRAGVESGELPEELDVARSARHVYVLAIGTMEEHVLAGTRPTRADTRELVAFSLRALGAPTP
jgi:AcrR family transcriptional regulator